MRGRAAAGAYVLTVAGVAGYGFATGSTAAILLAALLGLPSSVPGMIGFYLTVGLVSQVPGANPSGSSGSGWCSADGVCHETSSGDPAAWFLAASDLVGVLALTAAAVLNVFLISRLRRAP